LDSLIAYPIGNNLDVNKRFFAFKVASFLEFELALNNYLFIAVFGLHIFKNLNVDGPLITKEDNKEIKRGFNK